MLYNSPLEEFEEEVVIEDEVADTGRGHEAQLVVYNDDHNTFDWVVECFMDVLDYDQTQSEQLSLLIHFKGKATVKTAPKKILKPKKDALIDRGLSAVIEGGDDE